LPTQKISDLFKNPFLHSPTSLILFIFLSSQPSLSKSLPLTIQAKILTKNIKELIFSFPFFHQNLPSFSVFFQGSSGSLPRIFPIQLILSLPKSHYISFSIMPINSDSFSILKTQYLKPHNLPKISSQKIPHPKTFNYFSSPILAYHALSFSFHHILVLFIHESTSFFQKNKQGNFFIRNLPE